MRWTADMKARLEALLRAGKSARQIAEHLGIGRGAVSMAVHRDPHLKAIGFAGTGHGGARPKPKRQTKAKASQDRFDVTDQHVGSGRHSRTGYTRLM